MNWRMPLLPLISTLVLLVSSATAQDITVGAPKADARVTYPIVKERPAGSLTELKAAAGAVVKWTILHPFTFRNAVVQDDATLLVTVPNERLWVLADFGPSSQLLVIVPTQGPAPPVPPEPPGPEPPGPKPDVVVPDTYHVGLLSYKAAMQVQSANRKLVARAIAAVFQRLATEMKRRSLTVYDTDRNGETVLGAWTLAWRDSESAAAANPEGWAGWRSAVQAALRAENDAGRILPLDTWIGAFEEIQASLEAVQ